MMVGKDGAVPGLPFHLVVGIGLGDLRHHFDYMAMSDTRIFIIDEGGPMSRRDEELAAGRRAIRAAEQRMSDADLAAANSLRGRIERLRSLAEYERAGQCRVTGLDGDNNFASINNVGTGNSNRVLIERINQTPIFKVHVGPDEFNEAGERFPTEILFARVAIAIGAGRHLITLWSA